MNKIKLEMNASPENVSMARVVVAAYIAPLDPSVEELMEIKTAVSEAVTNAIIHGYGENSVETVAMEISAEERVVTINITDRGVGIENIESAREPLFTTKPEMERSGLGFTVMEEFMTKVEIESHPGEGTTVTLVKELGER
ncbi:MAG: anti-sigma F factor [Clostridiales bacterium]|jgi:stage II sporulation protein AB (anti-sigma F factor)|nr:anti-sigma F factor [Clostridiales bacterium]